MKKHGGFGFLESMIALLLLAPLMMVITRQMGDVSNTTMQTYKAVGAEQEISVFMADLIDDIKSAERIEAEEEMLSLISEDTYIVYSFGDERTTLTRSDAQGSERVLSELKGATFIPIDENSVGIYLDVNHQIIDLNISR